MQQRFILIFLILLIRSIKGDTGDENNPDKEMQIKLCWKRIVPSVDDEKEEAYRKRVEFKCRDKYKEGLNMILNEEDLKNLDLTHQEIEEEKRRKNNLRSCKNSAFHLKMNMMLDWEGKGNFKYPGFYDTSERFAEFCTNKTLNGTKEYRVTMEDFIALGLYILAPETTPKPSFRSPNEFNKEEKKDDGQGKYFIGSFVCIFVLSVFFFGFYKYHKSKNNNYNRSNTHDYPRSTASNEVTTGSSNLPNLSSNASGVQPSAPTRLTENPANSTAIAMENPPTYEDIFGDNVK